MMSEQAVTGKEVMYSPRVL